MSTYFPSGKGLADNRKWFVVDARGKTVGRLRQTVYRGIRRVDQHFKLTMTASNLVRIARILSAVPQGATP